MFLLSETSFFELYFYRYSLSHVPLEHIFDILYKFGKIDPTDFRLKKLYQSINWIQGVRYKVQEGARYKVQEGILYKVQSPFFSNFYRRGSLWVKKPLPYNGPFCSFWVVNRDHQEKFSNPELIYRCSFAHVTQRTVTKKKTVATIRPVLFFVKFVISTFENMFCYRLHIAVAFFWPNLANFTRSLRSTRC